MTTRMDDVARREAQRIVDYNTGQQLGRAAWHRRPAGTETDRRAGGIVTGTGDHGLD